LEHGPGAVFGAVIDDHYLVGNFFREESGVDRGEGGGERSFFVTGGDDDGEERKRASGSGSRSGHSR
jgi:hypothetical protein